MMTKKDPNFVRERKPEKTRVRVGDTKSIEDKNLLKQLPAQYLRALSDNPKLSACCRDTTQNYTYETFKSDEEMENPDLAVFTCTTCGRKHYRGAVGPGKL
jgi:hypothetical protein